MNNAEMTYDYIIYKTLTDPDFRSRLKEDPEEALNSLGIESSREVIDAFKKFDWTQIEHAQRAYTIIPT